MSLVKIEQTGLSYIEIDEILSFFKCRPEIERVIVFGSRAKGTYKPGSDIDLAVSGAGVDYSMINELSYLLNEESTLPYYFDILHFEGISSSTLLAHINEYGLQLNK